MLCELAAFDRIEHLRMRRIFVKIHLLNHVASIALSMQNVEVILGLVVDATLCVRQTRCFRYISASMPGS